MNYLLCINCQRKVARIEGKVKGMYTWFACCVKCIYGMEGYTEKELKALNKKSEARR